MWRRHSGDGCSVRERLVADGVVEKRVRPTKRRRTPRLSRVLSLSKDRPSTTPKGRIGIRPPLALREPQGAAAVPGPRTGRHTRSVDIAPTAVVPGTDGSHMRGRRVATPRSGRRANGHSSFGLLLDRESDDRSPLRPRAVIDAGVVPAKDVRHGEPGQGGAVAQAAVGHDLRRLFRRGACGAESLA